MTKVTTKFPKLVTVKDTFETSEQHKAQFLNMLSGKKVDREATMKSEKESDCKVYVSLPLTATRESLISPYRYRFLLATRADAANRVEGQVFLRMYLNEKRGDDYNPEKWKIWQAARATSAAPLYFDRIRVHGVEYIDGGMITNNLVWE